MHQFCLYLFKVVIGKGLINNRAADTYFNYWSYHLRENIIFFWQIAYLYVVNWSQIMIFFPADDLTLRYTAMEPKYYQNSGSQFLKSRLQTKSTEQFNHGSADFAKWATSRFMALRSYSSLWKLPCPIAIAQSYLWSQRSYSWIC